jgi:hypothetical protein
MSKNDYNENGFYSLCANNIYGNCITNCIYFYKKLRKHEPNFFIGYFYKKNDSPEFHVFLAFKTECGYYVYDPSREFDLFLPENVPVSANNNTFLLQNDAISITAGSSYGTYFLISEEKAKTVFFEEFKKDWKKEQIIWEFSLDEFTKPKPPKKPEKKDKKKEILYETFSESWEQKKNLKTKTWKFLENYKIEEKNSGVKITKGTLIEE